jgi:hypothetical protein
VREYVREKEAEAGSAWHVAYGEKPLSDAMIRKYQEKADRVVWRSHENSRKKLLRRHLAQRRNLYAKAVSQGDVRAALACVRDEALLLGLYPPAKIAPTSPDGEHQYQPGNLTPDSVAALVGDIASRLGLAGAGPDQPGHPQPPGPAPAGGDGDLPTGRLGGR